MPFYLLLICLSECRQELDQVRVVLGPDLLKSGFFLSEFILIRRDQSLDRNQAWVLFLSVEKDE